MLSVSLTSSYINQKRVSPIKMSYNSNVMKFLIESGTRQSLSKRGKLLMGPLRSTTSGQRKRDTPQET